MSLCARLGTGGEESVEAQVVKLAETLQQLQARITELEAQTVSSTPQEVRDQREETAKNTVASIRSLTSECKQLSDRSPRHMNASPRIQS
jgi:septal ring factor EnvC (AmiA/AmiB activator)